MWATLSWKIWLLYPVLAGRNTSQRSRISRTKLKCIFSFIKLYFGEKIKLPGMKWIMTCKGGFLKRKEEFFSGYIEISQKWGSPRTDFCVTTSQKFRKSRVVNQNFYRDENPPLLGLLYIFAFNFRWLWDAFFLLTRSHQSEQVAGKKILKALDIFC